jgi:hypothetical protein
MHGHPHFCGAACVCLQAHNDTGVSTKNEFFEGWPQRTKCMHACLPHPPIMVPIIRGQRMWHKSMHVAAHTTTSVIVLRTPASIRACMHVQADASLRTPSKNCNARKTLSCRGHAHRVGVHVCTPRVSVALSTAHGQARAARGHGRSHQAVAVTVASRVSACVRQGRHKSKRRFAKKCTRRV